MNSGAETNSPAHAQPGHKFFILATSDANKIDKEGRNQYGIKVADLIKSKKVFEANTWDELAEKAGIKVGDIIECYVTEEVKSA